MRAIDAGDLRLAARHDPPMQFANDSLVDWSTLGRQRAHPQNGVVVIDGFQMLP